MKFYKIIIHTYPLSSLIMNIIIIYTTAIEAFACSSVETVGNSETPYMDVNLRKCQQTIIEHSKMSGNALKAVLHPELHPADIHTRDALKVALPKPTFCLHRRNRISAEN
jgi:hypothetical protein